MNPIQLGPTPKLVPSSPFVWPCIIPFPIHGSYPYFLLYLPFHISFSVIASHYLFWNPWNYWCLEGTHNHQRVLTMMSRIRRDIKPLLQHNSVMRRDRDREHTKVPDVRRGLGFSLCAVPPDAYCPWISGMGSKVRTMSSRDNQCWFQTGEHTWSSECIYIRKGHIRVTRIGHVSGSGFGDWKIEQGEQKCEVEWKHETKQGLDIWNVGGNGVQGWMSKRINKMTNRTEWTE